MSESLDAAHLVAIVIPSGFAGLGGVVKSVDAKLVPYVVRPDAMPPTAKLAVVSAPMLGEVLDRVDVTTPIIALCPTLGDHVLSIAAHTPQVVALLGTDIAGRPDVGQLMYAVRRTLHPEEEPPWGPELLRWGATSVAWTPCSTEDVRRLVDSLERLGRRLGLARKDAVATQDVAHELLMNALYDAPVDGSGHFLLCEQPNRPRDASARAWPHGTTHGGWGERRVRRARPVWSAHPQAFFFRRYCGAPNNHRRMWCCLTSRMAEQAWACTEVCFRATRYELKSGLRNTRWWVGCDGGRAPRAGRLGPPCSLPRGDEQALRCARRRLPTGQGHVAKPDAPHGVQEPRFGTGLS